MKGSVGLTLVAAVALAWTGLAWRGYVEYLCRSLRRRPALFTAGVVAFTVHVLRPAIRQGVRGV